MIVCPPAGLNRWAVMPRQMLRAINGRNSLCVHELDKAKVQKPRAHVRPLPDKSGNVNFSAWRLAHAVKKADCARWPSSRILWTETAGFCLEYARLFNWDAGDLCLSEGMSSYYADFSASSLAGRIAQGMALLFLEENGYAYIGRFESEWKQRAVSQKKAWPKNKQKAPDFIAENVKKEWVLAESKGSFCSPDSKPDIKGVLKDGLAQLDGWDKLITPQPAKSFAIGTFLRESGDISTNEKSAIVFVDPEPEAPRDPVEFPADAVRRANYASWLSLMGFDDTAGRLRTRTGETRRHTVPVLTLAGNKYAVSVVSVAPRLPDVLGREFWDQFLDWPFGWSRSGIAVELVGIDLNILRILSSALSPSKASDLMQLEPVAHRDDTLDGGGGTFYGSIFSDGSLLGELRLPRSGRLSPIFEWIEVEL